MISINDERIKFYLEHEDRIKEWAEIKHDVCKIAHSFYLTLKDRIDEELRERSSSLPDDIKSIGPAGKNWVHVGLRREAWERDDHPTPAIAIEWNRKATGFTGQDIYCGASNGGAAVDRSLQPIFRPVLDDDTSKCWKLGFHWFVYRYLEGPKPRFWEASDGLAEYQDYLVGQLFDAWDLLASRVDEAGAA